MIALRRGGMSSLTQRLSLRRRLIGLPGSLRRDVFLSLRLEVERAQSETDTS